MDSWTVERIAEYRRWFDCSRSATRELRNDFRCNENLLEVFGRRTVIDIPYLQSLQSKRVSLGQWLRHPWNWTQAIAWGERNGLIGADWERYRFRLLDRRQQFVEIGPMSCRAAVRVINPTLPASELDKLLLKEEKRQDLADRRSMANNEANAKHWLDWAIKAYPEALLPDVFAEFAVDGIPYLRSYCNILLSAAGSRLDDKIGQALADICLGPGLASETPPSITLNEEDADAIDSLF